VYWRFITRDAYCYLIIIAALKEIRRVCRLKYNAKELRLNIGKRKLQQQCEAKLLAKIKKESVVGPNGEAIWRGLEANEAFERAVRASRRKLEIAGKVKDNTIGNDIKNKEDAYSNRKYCSAKGSYN